MAKGPTVYDVARRAGVSIATVSFAFRRPEKVRASTRESVLAAAHELGYVPSANARGLADGRTRALGLFSFEYLVDAADGSPGLPSQDGNGLPRVSTTDDEANANFRLFPLYVDEVQRGVELECARRGYALMIGGRGHVSTAPVLADIAGRVDGLAVFPGTISSEALHRIAWRIPVVELSEPSHHDELDHVTVENHAGVQELTRHLIADHGIRKLQFVGDPVGSDQLARFAGFRAALREAGLRSPAKPLTRPGGALRHTPAIVADLLNRDALPRALVCATDQQALAVLDALRGAGISVPGDVAVTGFDGIAAGRIVQPSLTTVRQPMEQMGREVVDILIDKLAHPDRPPVNRQLPVRVLRRESCGCPPAA